ncbi:MAG: ABC transporter permease [Gemmatimonadaceae bacterium]|nr:ABC transporter permease [Gloeobacterales cyanobacterium ES-bin-141]
MRLLVKAPLFAVVAILTLTLGIGANTAIFSLLSALVLRPLPYIEPERLVVVVEHYQQQPTSVSYPNLLDWQTQQQVFSATAGYLPTGLTFKAGTEPERLAGAYISANLFSILGSSPFLGRTFRAQEDVAGAERVVILGHRLWQRRFGAKRDVLGKTVALGSDLYTVVGVMPAGFEFANHSEFWLPLSLWTGRATSLQGIENVMDRNNRLGLQMVARLKSGVTPARAQANLDVIAHRLAREYPKSNQNYSARVVSLREHLVGELGLILWILGGSVGFVLLVACANVANLLLARSAVRQKEIAIRAALGATRFQIMRQLLIESALLGMLGGGAGLVLAVWSVPLLQLLLPPDAYRVGEIGLDTQVLVFALAVSLLSSLLFGLTPALAASTPDLAGTLKDNSSGSGSRIGRLSRVLVVCEVALALILLVGAGLMSLSLFNLQRADLGFRPQNVLTVPISLPEGTYPEARVRAVFSTQALEQIRMLPGVRSVALATALPLSGYLSMGSVAIEGQPSNAQVQADYLTASPEYFRVMGIPILSGRTFSEQDTQDSTGVVIINEVMARRHFPDQDPIGRRLQLETTSAWLTVIGVVGSVRQNELSTEPGPQTYRPYSQDPWPYMVFMVRTTQAPLSLKNTVEQAIHAIDPDLPISRVLSMEQVVAGSMAQPRLTWLLLALFAGLATLLSAIGVYGVMSYSVTLRTREIGIRMALGATPGHILKLIVGQGMVLVLIGLVLGVAGTIALGRILASLLYGVGAGDPRAIGAVSLGLALVTLVACWLPARRAARVNPMVAMRNE